MGFSCAITAMLLGVALLLVAARNAKPMEPPCRRRGGPCRMRLERGHCMSPNGCRDWGPPPKR